LEHPLRLLLIGLGDLTDDLFRQTLLLDVAIHGVGVIPAELVVVGKLLIDLFSRHGWPPLSSNVFSYFPGRKSSPS